MTWFLVLLPVVLACGCVFFPIGGGNTNDNVAANSNDNVAGNENGNQNDNASANANDNVSDNENVNQNDNEADNVNGNVADNENENLNDNEPANANGNVSDNDNVNQNDNAAANENDNAGDNLNANDNAAGPLIDLQSAGSFAILAGSTVTSTGATTVNGDLGVFPGTAVTGFPPGTVNGTIFAGDSVAEQAQDDLTSAYDDAVGASDAPVTVAGNLGGQTLVPGLYTSTSSLEISSGDLTLDALGDAEAVFIFQMASTLTTTVDRQVILSGGAEAANIFWQVGSSATLGTNSVFQGNILADQSITMNTGATLNGRALTRIGAVALDTNTITTP